MAKVNLCEYARQAVTKRRANKQPRLVSVAIMQLIPGDWAIGTGSMAKQSSDAKYGSLTLQEGYDPNMLLAVQTPGSLDVEKRGARVPWAITSARLAEKSLCASQCFWRSLTWSASGMDQGSDFECEFRARRIRVRGNFAHKSFKV